MQCVLRILHVLFVTSIVFPSFGLAAGEPAGTASGPKDEAAHAHGLRIRGEVGRQIDQTPSEAVEQMLSPLARPDRIPLVIESDEQGHPAFRFLIPDRSFAAGRSFETELQGALTTARASLPTEPATRRLILPMLDLMTDLLHRASHPERLGIEVLYASAIDEVLDVRRKYPRIDTAVDAALSVLLKGNRNAAVRVAMSAPRLYVPEVGVVEMQAEILHRFRPGHSSEAIGRAKPLTYTHKAAQKKPTALVHEFHLNLGPYDLRQGVFGRRLQRLSSRPSESARPRVPDKAQGFTRATITFQTR